jgi:anaerobic selenocysteine-containing dehydrogenase
MMVGNLNFALASKEGLTGSVSMRRLLYPLKRTGERGKGEFKRISWDEALDTVASELSRIKKTYGNEAKPTLTYVSNNFHNIKRLRLSFDFLELRRIRRTFLRSI